MEYISVFYFGTTFRIKEQTNNQFSAGIEQDAAGHAPALSNHHDIWLASLSATRRKCKLCCSDG
jgi:hypothetical protein